MRYFYCKNGDDVITVSTDTDISSSLIFEINSVYDSLIVEIRYVNGQIITFATIPMKEIYIFKKKGNFVVPIKIPNSEKNILE